MTTLEKLTAKRRAYVDAARDNGFEEGLRKLLADLYPDNAHFIYELLQNAEDAGAREVSFELQLDGLRFEHDGRRAFDLRDIESITGIGQSTKADDATSIGKFGVGFKAVFAYTQTPHVQSGEHSFAILDLFVPTPAPHTPRPGNVTTFWFPFDRAGKSPERAVAEIGRALHDVSRSTLLFLNSIRLIVCTFPDGDERLLERRDTDEHIVEIDSVHETSGPSYWYRITGDVQIGEKQFPVAAAFALKSTAEQVEKQDATAVEGKRTRGEYEVEPIEGNVFIYFPAIKETSGLKFHVHAPFASTVARDSVREDEGNEQLIEGLARMVADAMPTMREAGLVTEGLLSALPNRSDELPERYLPLRRHIVKAFELYPLTPKQGGGFAESTKLIRSISAVRASMTPADVDVLREISMEVGDEVATGWLGDRDGRPREFVASLRAINFGSAEIAAIFERIGEIKTNIKDWGDEAEEYLDADDWRDFLSWQEWIASKDDLWLRSFYTALGRLTQLNNNPYGRDDIRFYRYINPFPESLAVVPIVRIFREGGVQHVIGSEAFLPTAPGLQGDGLVLDSLVAFEEGQTKSQLADASALGNFFSDADVKKWDAAAQLEARFHDYATSRANVSLGHLDDLIMLKQLLDEKAVPVSRYTRMPIFVAQARDETFYWASAAELYVDEPYKISGLRALYESESFKGVRLSRLIAGYEGAGVNAAELAARLGATTSLAIRPIPIWNNPLFQRGWRLSGKENKNLIDRDWILDHFDTIVETYDETLLGGLWTLVVSAESAVATAVYRANASSQVFRIESRLLQALKTTPWILDQNGNLRLPADTTRDDLAEGLEFRANAPLLESIGFGLNAARKVYQERGDEARAKQLGFDSAEEARQAAQVIRETPDAFREFLRQRKGPVLPEASSPAPERRAHRVREQASEAPARQYTSRLRRVRIQEPGYRSTSKSYLIALYSNDDNVMVCQICNEALPFKVNSQYYFEAVQFASDAEHDLHENRLALCPTCAAKYRHARTTPLSDLRDDLLTQSVGNQGSISVEVRLADEDHQIRFVGKHAIDLQAALDGSEPPREYNDEDYGDDYND